MNQSYQRALNEVAILKKTLNSQKSSHQNTLHQLETTYKIIQEMKDLIKSQQQKNKTLNRQITDKNNKIQEISRQYQDHIVSIKQLIDQKDMQIKKYSQIKITDYDMMRLRILNQVQAQHDQQIEYYKNEIKKLQFINNESIYEIKVLKDKNQNFLKRIQDLKEQQKIMQQQGLNNHSKQLSRIYLLLQQQRTAKKQLQKKLQSNKQKNSQLIKRYHQQLQSAQKQVFQLSSGKQNNRKLSNFNSNSSGLINFKQNEFSLQNQKLKRYLKEKDNQISQLNSKVKAMNHESKKQINQLERSLQQANQQLNRYKQQLFQINDSKQKQIIKIKKQYERKQQSIKSQYQNTIELKSKQLKMLKTQFNEFRDTKKSQYPNQKQQKYQNNEMYSNLKQQNQELHAKIKKLNGEIQSLKHKSKQPQFQNRTTRAFSQVQARNKLKAANTQIMALLKDKIVLSQKLSQMNSKN